MVDADDIALLLAKVMSMVDELFDELDKFRKEFKAKELTPKKFAEMTEESASDNIYGSVKLETDKAYLILNLVDEGIYPSRSEFVRAAINFFLSVELGLMKVVNKKITNTLQFDPDEVSFL